jgi:hypothetical protein
MIVFQLSCEQRHAFEGWFRNREDFEDQLGRGLVTCPLCGSTRVSKELSPIAVHVGRRSAEPKCTEAPARPNAAAQQDLSPRAFFQALATFVEKHFEDVGVSFAQEARKIEAGETEARNIRGTTTPAEEEALREEGVSFLKIPVPKYDA